MHHSATRRSLAAAVLVVGLSAAAVAGASPLDQTGFVPELATPSFGLTFGRHSDSILNQNLDIQSIDLRLGYVPYPKVEVSVGLSFSTYDLDVAKADGKVEDGAGIAVGAKYQIPLTALVDTAAAVQVRYGSSDHISETEGSALILASRDISRGWTPYGAVGVSWNYQRYDETLDLGEGPEKFILWEKQVEPVLALGVRYMFLDHVHVAVELLFRDGLAAGASVGYRF